MPDRKPYIFLGVRLFFIITALIAAVIRTNSIEYARSLERPTGELLPIHLPIIFIFSAVGVSFVAGFQVSRPRAETRLMTKPSWFANPLSIYQPCQFFHMAAWAFLADGLLTITTTLIRHGSLSVLGGLFLAMGAGSWLGIHLLTRVFRDRFAEKGP